MRRSLRRFVEIEGVERTIVLSAQAFSALFPMLILVASVQSRDGNSGISDELVDRFELEGASAESVRRAFATPDEVTGSTGALGLFILILSALAFTRALQRLYERAWVLPSLGLRASGWGLLWLALFSGYWALTSVLGEGSTVLSLALGSVLWLVTPYILLARRVRWRRLVPQALLSATGLVAFGSAAVVFMPEVVASSAEQFGVVGVSFALLTWLLGASFTLVAAAALGAAIVEPRAR
jgi:membrane protein